MTLLKKHLQMQRRMLKKINEFHVSLMTKKHKCIITVKIELRVWDYPSKTVRQGDGSPVS